MAIAFSSTIHTLMSGYRVAGEQIAGFEIRYGDSDTLYKDVKTARLTLSGERDIDFAEANVGPMTYMPDISAVYAQLKAAGMVEIFPGSLLLNPSTFSVIKIDGSKVTIDIEGGDSPFVFEKDALASAVAATSNNNWKLPTATFDQLSAAAATYRESVDLELEDLGDSLAQEIVDRLAAVAAVQSDVDGNEADADAAIAAEAARVDALIASGMWLYADQAAFPPAADNHGRVVHSHADGAIYYSHAGAWHKIENEAEAEAARAALQNSITVLQADVDQNESDADASIAALTAALATTQADVDQNEADADAAINTEATARAAADITLQGNLDVESAARSAGDTATLSSANTYTDTALTNLVNGADAALDTLKEIGDALSAGDQSVTDALTAQITTESTARAAADTALSGRLDTLEADPTTATAVAAVQADVDQNEADSDAAEAALSARLDVLEADPTTATAVAAVQADVNQNEADADAAAAALSGRLDVLEADPTTATAVAAVQSDVDQNEADADAALALKAPLADPDFTGVLEVDTSARLEFADNLTKVHNVLRGTSITIGNNIQLNPAAANGRVEVEGEFYLRPSDLTDAADDTAAAAAGIIVGQVYRNGSQLMVRVS